MKSNPTTSHVHHVAKIWTFCSDLGTETWKHPKADILNDTPGESFQLCLWWENPVFQGRTRYFLNPNQVCLNLTRPWVFYASNSTYSWFAQTYIDPGEWADVTRAEMSTEEEMFESFITFVKFAGFLPHSLTLLDVTNRRPLLETIGIISVKCNKGRVVFRHFNADMTGKPLALLRQWWVRGTLRLNIFLFLWAAWLKTHVSK